MGTRWTAFSLAVIVGILVRAGGASAATSGYLLNHPAREHCKPSYTRQVRSVQRHGKTKRQVWCVPKTRKPTSIDVGASCFSRAGWGECEYTMLWSNVYGEGGIELLGAPVTYAIVDIRTQKTVASFSGTADGFFDGCTVVETVEGGVTTIAGRDVGSDKACGLAPVRMPEDGRLHFTGSFAGNTTYAPSVSKLASL